MTEIPEDIARAFPHAAERLRDLSRRNLHFGRLVARYRTINGRLRSGERVVEPTDDFHAGELRRQQRMLHHQIARMIDR